MPVPFNIVQIAGGTAVNSVTTPGSFSFTKAFTNANVAGNTLLVILGCDAGNIAYPAINTFSDTRGNAYTQIFDITHGTNTGPALSAYWFPNCAAGANSVTVSYDCTALPGSITTNFYPFMIVVEISGLAAPTLQADGTQQNFSTQNSSIAITNSVSATITLNVACANVYNTWAIIDLLASGVDNYFVCGIAVNNAGTDTSSLTPSTVGVPRLAASVPNPLDLEPLESTYLALYTMGPGVSPTSGLQRGNIDFDQIGLDARQGPLYGKQIVYSDGTFTQGGIPAFLIDGTLTNSGNNAGAGAGSGSVTSVTASSPLASSGGAAPNISLTGVVAVANGGNGTGSPGIVAGSGINVTGTWPTQTLAAAGGGTAANVPWSGLQNPSGNVSLTMGADTTAFAYNAATGSGVNLWSFSDTTGNSGTGAFIDITKGSGSAMTGIHLKQIRNADTQPLILLENNTGATMGISIGDVGGQATAHLDTGNAQFLIQRSTSALLQFDGTGGKWLTTMTGSFDGTVSTEIGITLANAQTMSSSSTAAVVSVQNNGTRLFDVAPAITTVKSGQFAIATSHTPTSSTDTGTAGTIAWDGSYLYACVATNSWVRLSAAMVTF